SRPWTGTDLVSTPAVRAPTSFLLDEVGQVRRVPENGDALQLGNELLEQLQALPSEISGDLDQPRDVAPRIRHARHQPDLDRIVNPHEDDRHLRRRSPSRKRGQRGTRP